MDRPTDDGCGGTRAVAATYLPANCCTAPVDVATVLRSHRGVQRSNRRRDDDTPPRTSSPCDNGKYKMLVSADDEGRLVCDNACPPRSSRCPAVGCCSCWILSVPLADDCHTYNCRLALLAAGGTVAVLHTTAAVLPGQPLKMWFPHDLQLMLHVPFLTPVNIRDERMYVCHECGYACEKPNPLKMHLALDCGRTPRAELWSRLVTATSGGGGGGGGGDGVDRTIEASFRFSLAPVEPRTAGQPPKSTAKSAFRPYSPESSASSDGGGCAAAPPSPPRPPATGSALSDRTPPLPPDGQYRHGGGDVAFFDRRCAEMETIVSNLGQSDQGHLCIYCGKVYSRKYGLKIHIRTHTGFKPLKCKYCYRPFGDPSNLNKHVRLHAEGDTPYKCDCCGKILVRKRDLDRHMKSRHAHAMPKSVFKMHVPV